MQSTKCSPLKISSTDILKIICINKLQDQFFMGWSSHGNILNPSESSLSGKSQECDPLHTSHYNCLQVEKIPSLALLQVDLAVVDTAN